MVGGVLLALIVSGGCSSHPKAQDEPTVGPGVVVDAEDWNQPDGLAWPSRWLARSVNGQGDVAVRAGRGHMEAASGFAWEAELLEGADLADQEIRLSWQVDDPNAEQYPEVNYRINVGLESGKSAQGYVLELGYPSDTVRLWADDHDWSDIANVESSGITTPGKHWLRIRVVGDRHQVRWWSDGEAEPDTWQMDVTDDAHASGRFFLSLYGGAERGAVEWDDLTITDLSSTDATNPPS
jgi:hypothetical protein